MKHNSTLITYEIGIDEAGRGPLAGPVAVGVAVVSLDFDWSMLPGVTDSKKLTPEKREMIYKNAKKLERAGQLRTVVVLGNAKHIDKKGIAVVIRECLKKGMGNISTKKDLVPTPECAMVKLDGGLKAPAEWVHQQTIIKGDTKEKVIGLASIMAKVTRDRYMRRRASLAAYTPYDFATHKGYGTKAHRTAIARHGLSAEHRQTFCKNIKSVV
jgi:ribonuclease HII